MKHLIYLCCALLILSSCSNSERSAESFIQEIYGLKQHAKYHNLKEFSVNTDDNWENIHEKYYQIDSSILGYMFRDDSNGVLECGTVGCYLYSWQERDTNFIEFTLIGIQEGICIGIVYVVLDKKGKLVGKIPVADECGDGGWLFNSTGNFTYKRTYERLSIEQEMTEDSELLTSYEGDSILVRYQIGKDGKVTEREISKIHYASVYPVSQQNDTASIDSAQLDLMLPVDTIQ